MDTDEEITVKQEPADDWGGEEEAPPPTAVPPPVEDKAPSTSPSSGSPATLPAPSPVTVQSKPEWTESPAGPVTTKPGRVSPESQKPTPVTSAARHAPIVTSSTTTVTSLPRLQPSTAAATLDKPLNFKLQISQDGGLRLAPASPSAATMPAMRTDKPEDKPVFFVKRQQSGAHQTQLYMNYDNKLYLLQASSGQQLNVKVQSPEKQPATGKASTSVLQGQNVCGNVTRLPSQLQALNVMRLPMPQQAFNAMRLPLQQQAFDVTRLPLQQQTLNVARLPLQQQALNVTRLPLQQQASKTVIMAPQVLPFAGRSVSLLKDQGINSLLQPTVTQVLNGQRNPPTGVQTVGVKNVPPRSRMETSGERKHTARKCCPESEKQKAMSLLKQAFCRHSPVKGSESQTVDTADHTDFEDGNNFPFKIDSVFSLASCEDQPLDIGWEEDTLGTRKETTVKVEEVCQIQKLTQDELLDVCGSSFVVLERLDHDVIASKGSQQIQSKCSDHCRNRTLNCLCMVGLIRCHEKRKRRIKMEEDDASFRAAKFLKKENESATEMKQEKRDNPVPEFSEKGQTDSHQSGPPSLIDSGITPECNISPFFSIGLDTSTSALHDTVTTVFPTTPSPIVTASGNHSMKATVEETEPSPQSPTLSPSLGKLSVTSDISTKIQQEQTMVNQNEDDKQQLAEERTTSPTDESEINLSPVGEGPPPSVGSTVGNVISISAATDNSLLSKDTPQTELPVSPKPTSVAKTSNECAGQDTHPPVNIIFKFVSLPTSSTQGPLSTIYSVAKTDSGPSVLSTAGGQMSNSSSAKGPISIVPKTVKIVHPTSVSQSTVIPVISAPLFVTQPSQTRVVSSHISTPSSIIKTAPPVVKIATNTAASSTVSLLKDLARPSTQQVPKSSASPMYILMDRRGNVLPASATKNVMIRPVVLSSASSANPSAQPAVSVHTIKHSLIQSRGPPPPPPSPPPRIITVSAPFPSGRQIVSRLTTSQPQSSTSLPSSLKTSLLPVLAETSNAGMQGPSQPVSKESSLNKVLFKTTVGPSVEKAGYSVPSDVKVIHVPSPSKLLRVVSSGKTSVATIMNINSIDGTGTTTSQPTKLPAQPSASSQFRHLVQSVKVTPALPSKQTPVAPPQNIKIISTPHGKVETPTARPVSSSSISLLSKHMLPKSSTSGVQSNTAQILLKVPQTIPSLVHIPALQGHGRVSGTSVSQISLLKPNEPAATMAGLVASSVSTATPSLVSFSGTAPLSTAASMPGSVSLLSGAKQHGLSTVVSEAPEAKELVAQNNSDTMTGAVSFQNYQDSLTKQPREQVVMTSSASSTIMSAAAAESKFPSPSNNSDSMKRKRATLERKYPLPPGVVIKSEPLTFGYPTETEDESHLSSSLQYESSASNIESLRASDTNPGSVPEPQSSVSTEPLATDPPLDYGSSDPPVSFQLTDPAFDSDSGDLPGDLDCPDLEPSARESDRGEYDEPPVLTPVLPLPSSSDSSIVSSGIHSSMKAPPSSSTAKGKKSRKRGKAAKRKTCPSSKTTVDVARAGETMSSDFGKQDSQEGPSGSSTSYTADSADPPFLYSPLTSLYSSQTYRPSYTEEPPEASSVSSSERIRQLKEMLKQQNAKLEEIRQQRSTQGPFVLADD